jgi:DNA mismatch repair protein MutL
MAEKRRIEVLDGHVADQIAAGEVVERPGSVVKELMENSLDAGATSIQLDIDAGGIGRIRVRDNGEGMGGDEVETAFMRHATSKMRRIEDLAGVATFGFRGEALPSIASVSRVVMRTRQQDDVAGTMVTMTGGEVVERREVGCPVGCDLEVTDLFFNTPARLKFMKKESTEASHVAEALVRLAVMRPEVAFEMRSSGRKVRTLTRVEKIEERVQAMFPKERLVVSEGTEHGIDVLAVLGPPERARAGAGSLYTYVNGRFIRDKMVLRAVTQAFAGILEPGRYPVGLLSLTMPPGSIDVNVHPQKIEVRFADTEAVFRAIRYVVGGMAARAAWSYLPEMPSIATDAQSAPYGSPSASASHRPAGRLVPPPSRTPVSRVSRAEESRRPETVPPNDPAPTPSDAATSPTSPSSAAAGPDEVPMRQISRPATKGAFSDLRILGQAKGLFLILEDERDLVIIDQHAAHERVTYEGLRDQLQAGVIPSQQLLIPHSVDLGPEDAERIAGHREPLGQLGLEVTQSGPDQVTIHAVPALLKEASPDRLLADMVLAIEEGRQGTKGDWEEKVLATMACHGSIRAGRAVATEEIATLLGQMDNIDFAGHCPHGRPVLTRIPWQEIRRRLGRS